MSPRCGLSCTLLLATLFATRASAGEDDRPRDTDRGELLLFASADGARIASDDPGYDTTDLDLTADVLGSLSAGKFRVFGELVLATEEQELERLQFGWQVAPETFLWLGRFHQPASTWNTDYHHGRYLQPSITRPSIEEWEDEGGVLPQHLEGVLVETRLPLGELRGLTLAAGGGIGPVMGSGGLEPLEIFGPRSFERHPAYSLQVAFLPEFDADNVIGLAASHSRIGFADGFYTGTARHIDLQVIGLFTALSHASWQLDATLYAVRADFVGQAGKPDSFAAGYLQLRRVLGSGVSVLGRFEGSADTAASSYLALFPDFVRQRAVLDLRWDFARRQAVSVEVADSRARNGHYREYRLQWSAVLP